MIHLFAASKMPHNESGVEVGIKLTVVFGRGCHQMGGRTNGRYLVVVGRAATVGGVRRESGSAILFLLFSYLPLKGVS